MVNPSDQEKITYFGETDSRNRRVRFGIKAKDRTKHVYVIGKTGMGKSTLLENMAIQDIKGGEGMAFLDPHGSTAEKLLEHVPIERIKDVIYFAPFDLEYPISFNVLEDIGADKRHLVVSGLMSTFKKIWVDAWSARMEYILSNALLALLEYPGATLLGVNRMLSDKDFRKKVVDNVSDSSVKSFWNDEFAKYTERQAAEAVPAIQNKIGQFTANPLIRNIIGQPKSSFDIRQVMDEKKILIINLSKGKVGEANANLLGSMLITKIYLAAMSRADASAKKLKELPNFYLFVDEFQSFANESFADILSEARKYKLNLTIAHQYIEQMSEEVRAAVFGNVGTMITFRVGAFDAEVLEKEFAPQFTAEDLVNLGIYQMYLKLMIDGVSSVPFSASSILLFKDTVINYVPEIIESSRKQFTKKKEDVENEIRRWLEEGRHVPGKKDEKGPRSQQFKQEGPRKEMARESPREGLREVLKEAQKPKEAPKEVAKAPERPKEENPRAFKEFIQKFTTPKVEEKLEIKEEAKPKEIRKKMELPPIESEPDDEFMPLKSLVKEVKKEEPVVAEKQVRPNRSAEREKGKIMTKENLAGLKSALESVIAKSKINPKEEPVVEEKIEKEEEIEKKKEEKIENKKEEGPKQETTTESNNNEPKEIPLDDLKKLFGLD